MGDRASPPDELVPLTNLDQPLFDGADATKRNLVDYLDLARSRMLPELADRPLSVVRVLRGQRPFMQKNLPRYAPQWVARTAMWAESAKREVHYPLCNDRRTLLWLANQRAVEYHPTLFRVGHPDRPTHLVLDLDPPPHPGGFALAVRGARLVRQVLAEVGLTGLVKTSGAKGLHVLVAVTAGHDETAAATRALAARVERLDSSLATTAFVRAERGSRVFLDSTRAYGATLAAIYSPRVRPGTPVSFPVRWEDLDQVGPADFTIRSAMSLLAADDDAWSRDRPAPATLPPELVAEGAEIPVARVQAMHEGKRRARARRTSGPESGEDRS
ncbi:MAG: DNA polymerase domain-containing protein [Pseudonocardia sp.]